MNAHHLLGCGHHLLGRGEEDVGGSVEFRRRAVEGVAEVDGLDSVVLTKVVEETLASAAGGNGVDVDAVVLEEVADRVAVAVAPGFWRNSR